METHIERFKNQYILLPPFWRRAEAWRGLLPRRSETGTHARRSYKQRRTIIVVLCHFWKDILRATGVAQIECVPMVVGENTNNGGKLEKISDDNPNDDDLFEWYEDDIIKHRDFNPALLYNSAFISLLSYFESVLMEISRSICQLDNVSMKKNKFEKQIDCYKRILTPYYDFIELQNEWEFISECYEVRNKLVHQYGKLTKLELVKYQALVEKYSSIEIDFDKRLLKINNNKILLELNRTIEFVLRKAINKITGTLHKKHQ